MAVTSKGKNLNWAFLLDGDGLRYLAELLEEQSRRTEETRDQKQAEKEDEERIIVYVLELSDNSTVRTASLDEVLALPNSSERRITSLSINTQTPSGLEIFLRFADREYFAVSYDLSGKDDEVLSFSSRLEDHLLGLRQ